MRKIGLIGHIGLIGFASNALAEHRLALVIDNHQYSREELRLDALDTNVTQKLESHGFRIETWLNTDGNQLKYGLRDFAPNTPANGTVLLYYHGNISPNNGKDDLLLVDVKSNLGRGASLKEALRQLSSGGGSARNLLILDAPKIPKVNMEVPAGCEIFHEDLDKALGTLPPNASKSISPPDQFVLGKKTGDEWVNAKGMVFCWIPPGKFTMGSPDSELGRHNDEPQREIEIKEGFWLSKYEFIRGHYKGNRHRASVGNHKLHPINAVSQSKDIRDRLFKPLTKDELSKGRLPVGWEYNLPSEEQWEYAARGGTTTTYSFGNDPEQLPKYANFADKSMFDTKGIYTNHAHRSLVDGEPGIARVGQFAPNPWGLHDIHGNLSEWTDTAVIKGGSWLSSPDNLRSAYRQKLGDRDQRNYVGVRAVIRKVPPKPPKKK